MQISISRFRLYIVSLGIVLSGAIAVSGLGASASAVIDNDPDCDTVAIIRCGAFSADAMRQKAADGDVPRIYNAFNISQDDLRGTYVDGIVWRDGRVTVDGKTVATDAMTAGRNFGGTPIPGTNAGKYPTSRFATEGQTAFVRMVDGIFDFAVIKACGNPVSATPKNPPTPQEPTYECVSLTTEKVSRTKVRFTAEGKVSGGATIEKYEFGFGDGFGITVNEKSYTYDYKQPGIYETNVVIHIKLNGTIKKVTSRACEKSVTIRAEEVPQEEPCPYDRTLPKDSPNCKPPKDNCTVPGKEHLPKDSPECKQDEIPAVIAETGPGALLGGVVGSSALGYGAYSYLQSRRELLSKLLKR